VDAHRLDQTWVLSLVFVACISGNKVGNIADADLESWPRAVRILAELPATVVIPGHGDRLDPNLIQNTLDVLTRATGTAKAGEPETER